jgi:hypothetical protein
MPSFSDPLSPILSHSFVACSDTYYGGYAADAKSGAGLYVFASGASYLGAYAGGRREGRGLMVMPDGGVYDGEWAADKFEGQVGGRLGAGGGACPGAPLLRALQCP